MTAQEQKTWLAPLHIAVMRELVDTMHELVNAGADVNIVGGEDVMPLALAEKLPPSSVDKQRIVEFLTSMCVSLVCLVLLLSSESLTLHWLCL